MGRIIVPGKNFGRKKPPKVSREVEEWGKLVQDCRKDGYTPTFIKTLISDFIKHRDENLDKVQDANEVPDDITRS